MSSSSSTARATSPVLADLVPWVWVRELVLVGTFTVAIAASSQLAFMTPWSPVPVTAQTFVVLLGAAALGGVRAGSGAGLYFAAGALGVPWFAATSGITLGYIAGFVLAALLVGRLARAGWTSSYPGAVGAMVLGSLAIYAVGAPVLGLILGLGPWETLMAAVVPFLIGDALKVAAAGALLPPVQRYVDRVAD